MSHVTTDNFNLTRSHDPMRAPARRNQPHQCPCDRRKLQLEALARPRARQRAALQPAITLPHDPRLLKVDAFVQPRARQCAAFQHRIKHPCDRRKLRIVRPRARQCAAFQPRIDRPRDHQSLQLDSFVRLNALVRTSPSTSHVTCSTCANPRFFRSSRLVLSSLAIPPHNPSFYLPL
ncbi:hypothetical protein FB451DRAFT_1572274 [Mycena latifolia]|nr:hypothetical protein FB451DRAFT_1572274 [Mycena latifolia]